jgi:electron transfer flavoprotein alpha subunit
MASGILVWSDQPALVRELTSEARRLADTAGWRVVVCSVGHVGADDGAALASVGADVVYSIETDTPTAETCVEALAATTVRGDAGMVLVGATKLGMEVAPRLAERSGASYAAWAVGIAVDAHDVATARCMLYAGTGLATYRLKPGLSILTVASGVFDAEEVSGRSARVESLTMPGVESSVRVLGDQLKPLGSGRLEEASSVVDVGQGVRHVEDLEMTRLVAGLLEAQVACSRPVASNHDWFPEWLGLSGTKVKPELCLTVGISGAIQHIVGIRDARVIAAVNNDENAAIFLQADVGVVADLHEFLPVLSEHLIARGIHPAWS